MVRPYGTQIFAFVVLVYSWPRTSVMQGSLHLLATVCDFTPSPSYENLIENLISMQVTSCFWHTCFEHEIFFHWCSGKNNSCWTGLRKEHANNVPIEWDSILTMCRDVDFHHLCTWYAWNFHIQRLMPLSCASESWVPFSSARATVAWIAHHWEIGCHVAGKDLHSREGTHAAGGCLSQLHSSICWHLDNRQTSSTQAIEMLCTELCWRQWPLRLDLQPSAKLPSGRHLRVHPAATPSHFWFFEYHHCSI